MRSAATLLPRPVLSMLANGIVGGLNRTHLKLLSNLARLEPAVVGIAPLDLPYRFTLRVGRTPVTVAIIDRGPSGADAEVSASVATLLDLVEGRIDSDTLFFRRDLTTSGNTAVVAGVRNVLDREDLCVADEMAALFGPLGAPACALARHCDRILDRVGARVAAMHRTLHPPTGGGADATSELVRCQSEITPLTARLAKLEARQKRRDEKAA